MSFSSELKRELSMVYDKPRHCRLAELRAVTGFIGRINDAGDGLILSTDNELAANVSAELIRKIFSERISVSGKPAGTRKSVYSLNLKDAEAAMRIYEALKLVGDDGDLKDPGSADPALLIAKRCCKCAFLRGAFIAAGTISDPDRYYHLEFICRSEQRAETTRGIISDLGAKARVTKRQRYFVVYVKDSNMISDLLGFMGARIGLLELENRRIIRGTRGNVNRRVNCETANIEKTAAAAAAQILAIRKIERSMGLASLPDGLDEIARLRVEYPSATLQELGQMLDTPIGKSGVNHRLRKIIEISKYCDVSEVT